VTLLFVVVAIGIVAGVAILLVRDKPLIDDDPAPVRRAWPPPGGVGSDELAEARFTVALRGYRMDEVDRVLADAGAALEERDRRIAALEEQVRAETTGATGGSSPDEALGGTQQEVAGETAGGPDGQVRPDEVPVADDDGAA
jgi:DivIVA domain-containing protein